MMKTTPPTTAPATATSIDPAVASTDTTGDATIWVILGLFGVAAAAVFLARLRLL
jgi:hypothetical protein